MIKSKISNNSFVSEILASSQREHHHDVTIVCSSGTIQSNSFVLAAVFPLLRGILETPLLYPDPAVILIPDLDKTHLETFLNDLLHYQSIVTISRDLKDLMQFELEVFNVEDVTDIPINSDRDTSFVVDSQFPCEHCEQERVSSLRPVYISLALLSPGG